MATKGKRDKRSFGSTRVLPSGKVQARYVKDGVWYKAPVTFTTKQDANRWLSGQETDISRGTWTDPNAKPTPNADEAAPLTFGEYAATWLDGRSRWAKVATGPKPKDQLSARTAREYRRMLDAVTPDLGGVELAALDRARIKTWHDALCPDTPTERAHRFALVRTVLNAAVDDEAIPVNPARIKGAGRAGGKRRLEPATLAELEAITAAMPERYRLMVTLAAWCALRFGEVVALRRSDVVLPAKGDVGAVVKVRRAVTWTKANGAVVSSPKTEAGVRDVAVPPHVVKAIRAHLKQHAEAGRDGRLFPPVEGGDFVSHGTVYKRFSKARVAAGRPDLRFHDLRHTGAVNAAIAGATLAELMDRLGHTTAEVAMRYQHVAAGRQAEIARRMSALVG